MAAPTASTRLDPTGIKMEDGYRTLVTFATDRDVRLWERSITPPGLEGGEPIDTTTMHNDVWRSMAPRHLKSMTEFQMECGYDPKCYDELRDLINVETTVTVLFPDTSTLAFYGFLRNFQPNALEEGSFPTATVTVVPTNADPTTGAEEAPVLTSAEST